MGCDPAVRVTGRINAKCLQQYFDFVHLPLSDAAAARGSPALSRMMLWLQPPRCPSGSRFKGWCHLKSSKGVGGAGCGEEVMLCCGRGLSAQTCGGTLACCCLAKKFALIQASFMARLEIQALGMYLFLPSQKHHSPPGIIEIASLIQC